MCACTCACVGRLYSYMEVAEIACILLSLQGQAWRTLNILIVIINGAPTSESVNWYKYLADIVTKMSDGQN